MVKKIHDEFLEYNDNGEQRTQVSHAYYLYWARTIVFDTLISNTDRHAENWAFLLSKEAGLMAPFYDNASSMGCEVEQTGLDKWFTQNDQIVDSKVRSYVRNGCRHLRNGEDRFHFEELARQVLSEFPEFRAEFEATANLDLLPIEQVLGDISNLDGVPEPARMAPRHSAQIIRLLQEGQARVIRVLEEKP